MKKQLVLSALSALVLLASCEKEASIQPGSASAAQQKSNNEEIGSIEGVKVDNGRFIFENRESAAKALSQIGEMNEEEFQGWLKSVSGGEFTSYVIQDSTFELPLAYNRVLNKEGAFQVGDEVAIYQKGREFVANANEYEEIRYSGKVEGLPSMELVAAPFQPEGEGYESDPTVQQRGNYNVQKQFSYQGRNRKLVHEVIGWQDRWFLVVEARNKFEYLKKRTFGPDTWEIESTNCYKEMAPMSISWRSSFTVFGSGGPGQANFGTYKTTWGNNTLVSNVYLPADCINYVQIKGGMYSEFWGNELNSRNLTWNYSGFCK
ncbi:hypothetical protein [Hymenobacter pini]|uniref:hypothetical protein n=1 Tax=Hymenobacter pini TaxID=2880879 RepID=UPI001CF10CB6|nr:hypothetical protein [Hymenobacter pini]MCA8830474.1 hypothetical protein [Hymenobacter pini]